MIHVGDAFQALADMVTAYHIYLEDLYFFCGSVFFCLVFSMPLCAPVYMCLVVTCWEKADLLALVCGVQL